MIVTNFKCEAFLQFNDSNIEQFIQLCEDVINKITSNRGTVFKLKSSTHELVVNCLEHGYEKKDGLVSYSLSKTDNNIILEVSDFGVGVRNIPTDYEDCTETGENVNVRGWGLMIISRISERVTISENNPHGSKIQVVFPT